MSAHVINTTAKAYKSTQKAVCIYQAYYESLKVVKVAKVMIDIAIELMF